MKITSTLLLLMFATTLSRAQQIKFPQLTIVASYGKIGVKEGNLFGIPGDKLYSSVLDSARTLLEKNDSDTSALFLIALMKSQKNVLNPRTEEYRPAVEEAFASIEKGFQHGLNNLVAKVLRARICNQLKSFYIADEGWKYKDNLTRKKRKEAFEKYQALSNKYYTELKELDPNAAWDYQKLIKVDKYPLEVK